jgi:hypothetical protein
MGRKRNMEGNTGGGKCMKWLEEQKTGGDRIFSNVKEREESRGTDK